MKIVQPPEGGEKPSTGQDFIKKIGPAGCALFLLLAVLTAVLCLTVGKDPIPGYKPPHDTAYWAAHTNELAAELTDNVLPRLEYPARAEADGDVVTVTIGSDGFVVTRAAVLRYFDESLFSFREGVVS